MLRVATADPAPPKQVRLVRTSVNAVGVVEHFTDFYAATDQFASSCLDVGGNEVHSLGRAGLARGDVLSEDDRAPGTGWRI
jgi:hypothetical protein